MKKAGKKQQSKQKTEPIIRALKESGISLKLLAKHSGLPYIRIHRLMIYGFQPRNEEIAALQEAIAAIFKKLIPANDRIVHAIGQDITTR